MQPARKWYYFVISFATLIAAFYIPAWLKPFLWLIHELALWIAEKF